MRERCAPRWGQTPRRTRDRCKSVSGWPIGGTGSFQLTGGSPYAGRSKPRRRKARCRSAPTKADPSTKRGGATSTAPNIAGASAGAWVELHQNGRWVPRKGRARDGCLDRRRAYPLMARVITEHEVACAANHPNDAKRPSTTRPTRGSPTCGPTRRASSRRRFAGLPDLARRPTKPARRTESGRGSCGRSGNGACSRSRRRRSAASSPGSTRGCRAAHGQQAPPGAARDLRVRAARGDLRPAGEPGARGRTSAPRRSQANQTLRAGGGARDRRARRGRATSRRPVRHTCSVETEREWPRSTSKTLRCSSSRRSPGCAWASCWRCAGATSTSRAPDHRRRGNLGRRGDEHRSRDASAWCRWPTRRRRGPERSSRRATTSPAATTSCSAAPTAACSTEPRCAVASSGHRRRRG